VWCGLVVLAMTSYGQVTGTDLADEVLACAEQRVPEAKFVAGDFMSLDLGLAHYDVAISLEVLSHVADQQAFVGRIAELLKPEGLLMLATQNKPALLRNDIPPSGNGQLRHWVDRKEPQQLLAPQFFVECMFSITPQFNRGTLRVINSNRLITTCRVGQAWPCVENGQTMGRASLARLDHHALARKK
jgi:2-polyprenyl-3-methyl-5-hydroxy-6-metoxy-1,4-benzoquinol methylase